MGQDRLDLVTRRQDEMRLHFLEPEVRDGVEVSAELKAAWKVMLDMLEEFIRICEKYHLRYCMDGGSLLGAIRHKGFIPWDDDMDVSLPREDFNRFLKVAQSELKHPYFFQYTTTDPEHSQAYACLRNVETAAIDTVWTMYNRCFCMGIGIDIFPIDYLPDDARVQKMLKVNRMILRVFAHAQSRVSKRLISKLVDLAFRIVYRCIGVQRLVRWRDANFGAFSKEECARCSNVAFNLGNERAIWPKEIYDERVIVPFEYLEVPVPVGYELYLEKVYGKDWRTPIRGKGDHDALVVNTQKSYRDILVERFGYKKEWVEKLP